VASFYSFSTPVGIKRNNYVLRHNFSGTQHTIFLLRGKTMLVLLCVNLIPKALVGQFRRDTGSVTRGMGRVSSDK
jgi:hypothetical protein